MTVTTTANWIERAKAGGYRATDINTSAPQQWVVEGLLPRTGASMWFGAGGVGKTQLLVWLAAHLAAVGDGAPDAWLGAPIRRRGQILLLSTEDLREQLLGRLASILRSMAVEGGAIDPNTLGERIHLLPFLSLSRDEFDGPSPRLFEQRGATWRPSDTLKGVEAFIADWNEAHEERDQIIGVVLDSAVSMVGFDLNNTEATTDLLFHLNRRSREQDVFWAVIGHQPKTTSIDSADPALGAVGRLRGSAMWSTTPRTVIEVRTAIGREYERIVAISATTQTRDALVVTVVKANTQGADFDPRYLARERDAAFRQIALAPIARELERDLDIGTARAAVIDAIRVITDGGNPGATFSRADLATHLQDSSDPRVDGLKLNHEGAKANASNLAGILRELQQAGAIASPRNGPAKVIDLSLAPRGS